VIVGGGKSKGTAFERVLCVKLSLWVTDGQRKDVFWRSAISGGRATRRRLKGEVVRVQFGDICAIDPLGYPLTDVFLVECKHYKNLQITSFLLSNTGLLAKFWAKAKDEAVEYGRRPMLIAKQNNFPTFVLLPRSRSVKIRVCAEIYYPQECMVVLLEDMLAKPFTVET
jgi:hypothetical protein